VFENDRARLEEIRLSIRAFLRDEMKLELHPGKSQIYSTGGNNVLGVSVVSRPAACCGGRCSAVQEKVEGVSLSIGQRVDGRGKAAIRSCVGGTQRLCGCRAVKGTAGGGKQRCGILGSAGCFVRENV